MTGVLIPLPKQGRGGDVRNAPYPPLRAVDHILNQHTVVAPTEHGEGGDAA